MSRSETNLPVVAQSEFSRMGYASGFESVGSAIDAQRLGQAASVRGLRGGRPVLEAARTVYLSTQWSGDYDRRPEPGLLTRTRV